MIRWPAASGLLPPACRLPYRPVETLPRILSPGLPRIESVYIVQYRSLPFPTGCMNDTGLGTLVAWLPTICPDLRDLTLDRLGTFASVRARASRSLPLAHSYETDLDPL